MAMYMQRHPTGLCENSRGFSLVELMVAMLVTLILLAGIGQIFLSSKKSFNIQDSLSRMQENGRYAIETLAQDIRRAGYWGGNADITKIGGTTIVVDGVDIIDTTGSCVAGNTDWALKLNRHIFGKNDAKDDGKGDYACLNPYPYVPGTDILVVRYASPWVIGGTSLPLPCATDTTIEDCYANTYLMRSSLFKGKLFQGEHAADTENHLVTPPTRTAELISRIYFVGTVPPVTLRNVPALAL